MTPLFQKNVPSADGSNDNRLVTRTVEKVIHHTREIFEIYLSRSAQEFSVGQFLSLCSSRADICREYSIASGIREPWFSFIIRHLAEGKVTEFLHNLKPGDTLQTSLPTGSFRPGFEHQEGNFIFIASGTGIAPFRSYLKSFPEKPPTQLLYGVRYLEDAIGFSEMARICPVHLAISREKVKGQHHGRVTDLLSTLPLQTNTHYYLCGLDSMIKQITDWLVNRGTAHSQIHHEGTATNL